MADIFEYTSLKQAECDKRAEELLGSPVHPTSWQGCHMYTAKSVDGRSIIQFRTAEEAFAQSIVDLAKQIRPEYAPETQSIEYVNGTTISVWRMVRMPGVGFGTMVSEDDIRKRLIVACKSLAKFFVESWKAPQTPSHERLLAVRTEYGLKLQQPAKALPQALQVYLPLTLTHTDLSSMNMLFDSDDGHLKGVMDWAEAQVRPFGIDLWGLESILGYENSSGWHWLDDDAQTNRKAFARVFRQEVGGLSLSQLDLLEKSRCLGLLLRYGYVWQDGTMMPVKNVSKLDALLRCHFYKPRKV